MSKSTVVTISKNNNKKTAQVVIKGKGTSETKHLRQVRGTWLDRNGKAYTVK